MMRVNLGLARTLGLVLVALGGGMPVSAQEGRDPTIAPGETAAVQAPAVGVEGMTVLVRDGKPYLVVGTRLYAVGDKVGAMRVDRISESEVWLHDGRALLKVPRFAGIERSTVVAKPGCAHATGEPRPANRKSNPHTVAAPCEDTQP
jgi:hypothetical protein